MKPHMTEPKSEAPRADLLIVDDKPANLRLLAAMLVEHGFKVRSAISGPLALNATQVAPPDLILLDVNMPEMNGYQVCERLKDNPRTHDIPVIFISALDETADKVQAFKVGGVDYITKPFQLEEVLARVETHLTLRRLQKRLQETNRKFEEELALASSIQASFLPRELPQIPGWQLAATLIPAREMSGDFYDIIPLPDSRLGLVVADVTDKGTGAALYMTLSRTLIRTYAPEYGTLPQRVFDAAHHRILSDTETTQFVTVFYGVLEPSTGKLVYSNAGHNPPLLISQASGEPVVQELGNTGPPLGLRVLQDLAWEERAVQLFPGDRLVLYSDGITEAENEDEQFFEVERLLQVAQEQCRASAQDLQKALLARVQEFMGEAPQHDDITLMVLVRD
jgi:sigma-B regulation protein RsbU (phosphoserine phosphatase)